MLAAQEYECQLSKIVTAKSDLPQKMTNDHYKYMVAEEQTRLLMLREMKQEEIVQKNRMLQKRMSEVVATNVSLTFC